MTWDLLYSKSNRTSFLNKVTPGFGKVDLRAYYAEKFRIVMLQVGRKYPIPAKKYHAWGLTTDGIRATKKCWTRTYGLWNFQIYGDP